MCMSVQSLPRVCTWGYSLCERAILQRDTAIIRCIRQATIWDRWLCCKRTIDYCRLCDLPVGKIYIESVEESRYVHRQISECWSICEAIGGEASSAERWEWGQVKAEANEPAIATLYLTRLCVTTLFCVSGLKVTPMEWDAILTNNNLPSFVDAWKSSDGDQNTQRSLSRLRHFYPYCTIW